MTPEDIDNKAREAFSEARKRALLGGSSVLVRKGDKLVEQWWSDGVLWEDEVRDLPCKKFLREDEMVKRVRKNRD